MAWTPGPLQFPALFSLPAKDCILLLTEINHGRTVSQIGVNRNRLASLLLGDGIARDESGISIRMLLMSDIIKWLLDYKGQIHYPLTPYLCGDQLKVNSGVVDYESSFGNSGNLG